MSKKKEKSALQQEIDSYEAVNSFCMLIAKKLNDKIRRDYMKAENDKFFIKKIPIKSCEKRTTTTDCPTRIC